MADKAPQGDNIKVIQRNRKAWFNYEIVEKLEAGLVLTGSEVKSIRDGKVTIQDAWGKIQNGELWLVGLDVSLYPQAGPYFNHEPHRVRKLLLHKQELRRLASKTKEKGWSIIPLSLYFKDGYAKVELGLARGKKQYDKRATIKERDAKRDLQRRMMKP